MPTAGNTQRVIFDRKNILVIGGAGFIGSHLCDELVKTAKVICVDNYISGSVNNIAHLLQHPNFIFLRHDITDPFDLEQFPELELFQVQFQGVQEVYFLACPTMQLGHEEFAITTAKTNSLGVLHGLELAKKYDAKFLFTSTHSVYGDPLEGQKTFAEDYWGFVDFLGERASYNEGKRFAETITMAYDRHEGIDTKIARIFNTYGPRMRGNSGRQLPDFVRSALEGKDLVILGDGTSVDNYCYVIDIVQGLIALMRSALHEPINFGNPVSYRIIDIAKKVISILGSQSKILFAQELSGLLTPALPDVGRAREKLGWFPVTDIDTGLQRTVEDMRGSRVLSYSPPAASA